MTYMERMDAYALMDTKIMDRIMKELWSSDIDVSGNFMAQSTAYQIWNAPESEQDHRFYVKRDLSRARSHKYILSYWDESS